MLARRTNQPLHIHTHITQQLSTFSTQPTKRPTDETALDESVTQDGAEQWPTIRNRLHMQSSFRQRRLFSLPQRQTIEIEFGAVDSHTQVSCFGSSQINLILFHKSIELSIFFCVVFYSAKDLAAHNATQFNPSEDDSTSCTSFESGNRSEVADRQIRKLTDGIDFLSDFNPETSSREQRKMTRKYYAPAAVRKNVYDEQGRYHANGADVCDCLEDACDGCHFPCPSCESHKCGTQCRVQRRWTYESIEHDGKDLVVVNKYAELQPKWITSFRDDGWPFYRIVCKLWGCWRIVIIFDVVDDVV